MQRIRYVLHVLFLIYTSAATPAQAQSPLHDLLALIEVHNPELQEQRRLGQGHGGK